MCIPKILEIHRWCSGMHNPSIFKTGITVCLWINSLNISHHLSWWVPPKYLSGRGSGVKFYQRLKFTTWNTDSGSSCGIPLPVVLWRLIRGVCLKEAKVAPPPPINPSSKNVNNMLQTFPERRVGPLVMQTNFSSIHTHGFQLKFQTRTWKIWWKICAAMPSAVV